MVRIPHNSASPDGPHTSPCRPRPPGGSHDPRDHDHEVVDPVAPLRHPAPLREVP
ncbi:hypothetical protein SGLAM104S_06594 [Streptomyces glaucescens]